jgi:hypothetical protein
MIYAFVKTGKQGETITGFFVDLQTGQAVPIKGKLLQTTSKELLAIKMIKVLPREASRPYLEAQGIISKPRKPKTQTSTTAKTTKPRRVAKREDQSIQAKEQRRVAKIERYMKIIQDNEQKALEGNVSADTILRANAFIKKRIAWYSQPGADPDQDPPLSYMRG